MSDATRSDDTVPAGASAGPEAVIVVKCKAGHKREIRPGGSVNLPMCDICYRPMFPVLVTMRKAE